MSGDFVLPPELEQIKQAPSVSLPRGQLLKGLFGETKPQQPGEGEIWAWVDALPHRAAALPKPGCKMRPAGAPRARPSLGGPGSPQHQKLGC